MSRQDNIIRVSMVIDQSKFAFDYTGLLTLIIVIVINRHMNTLPQRMIGAMVLMLRVFAYLAMPLVAREVATLRFTCHPGHNAIDASPDLPVIKRGGHGTVITVAERFTDASLPDVPLTNYGS